MFKTILFSLIIVTLNNVYAKGDNLKLVIDQDGGADDVMAMFMAILYEKHFNGPSIVAITTTHGNVDEPQVYKNLQRILRIACRPDIPIYRGSNDSLVENIPSDHFFGKDGIGDTEYGAQFSPIPAQNIHAAIGLIEMSKQYEGNLVVVALGAFTNIALAIRLDPDFYGRLAQLYVAGGHIAQGSYGTDPEFNVEADVEAYRVITDTAYPEKVTVVPSTQTKEYLNITKTWREKVFGAINTKAVEALNSFEKLALNNTRYDSWSLLDPAVMSFFLKGEIVTETKCANGTVILCGEQRGVTTFDFVDEQEANLNVVIAACRDTYQQFLLDVFSKDF